MKTFLCMLGFLCVTHVTNLEIRLILSDVNDEDPIFTNEPRPFYATLSSTAAEGTVVYTVTATDPDTNPRLTLKLDSVTSPYDKRFKLRTERRSNKVTEGIIMVNGTGTFQRDDIINVMVSITDENGAGVVKQITQKSVQIKVGLRDPQIFHPSYTGSIFETVSTNRESVQGPDNTPLKIQAIGFQGGTLSYKLLDDSGSESTMFVITSNGHITNLQEMDYETSDQRRFSMSISVTETFNIGNQETELTSFASLTIDVKDENDNIPKFVQ